MVKVTFITAQDQRIEAEAAAGTRLLEVGQNKGLPLEGTCEGQMACSTCHVVVAAARVATSVSRHSGSVADEVGQGGGGVDC